MNHYLLQRVFCKKCGCTYTNDHGQHLLEAQTDPADSKSDDKLLCPLILSAARLVVLTYLPIDVIAPVAQHNY